MLNRKLTPKAAGMLLRSDAERIEYLKTPKWVSYRDADAIIEKMFEFSEQDRSPGNRIENLMIYGDPSNGKSFLAHTFRELIHEQYDAVEDEFSDEGKSLPAVLAEFPIVPDERRLYSQILKAMHIPHNTKDNPQHLLHQIVSIFRELRVKILILDEFHNMLCGPSRQQLRILVALKSLSNELKLPIVLVGTIEAKTALYVDQQFATRFRSIQLPLWSSGKKINSFLSAYERVLPLKNLPGLLNIPVKSRIISRSRGLVGEMTRLIRIAAIEAITSKTECLTSEIIDRIDLDSMDNISVKEVS